MQFAALLRKLAFAPALAFVAFSGSLSAQSTCSPQTLCAPTVPCPPPVCAPGTINQTTVFANSTTPTQPPLSNLPISLPRFVPGPGQTLVMAEVQIEAEIVNGSVQARNLTTQPLLNQQFTLSSNVNIQSNFAPLNGSGAALTAASVAFNTNLGPTTWPGPPANPCDFTNPQDTFTQANINGIDAKKTCIVDPGVLSSVFTGSVGQTVDFTYSALDNSTHTGGGNLCIIFLNFTKVNVKVTYYYCQNTPPVANDDTATVCAGGAVSIPVLQNDSDPNGGVINCNSILILTQPQHGTVQIVNNCTAGAPCPGICIEYTSTNPAFQGLDTFVYRVSDNVSRTDTATVSVNVCKTIAQDDVGIVTCAGQSVSIPVLQNDNTSCGLIDCNSLVILTQPVGGTVQIVNNCTAGAPCPGKCIVFTPAPGFVGNTSFTYRVGNNQTPSCTDDALVQIQVCAVEAPDVNSQVCAGGTVDICIPATTTCGTINCSSLSVTVLPSIGTATPQPNCSNCGAGNCCIRYTAPAGAPAGPVTFTYQVSNNGTPVCTDTGVVTVNICRVTANADTATVCSGGSVTIPVLINDTTTCGSLNCATLAIASGPANGTAVVNQSCGAGGAPCPNTCITYTAPAGFTGTVSFTYTIASLSTPACTATGTVTVNVCATNAPDVSATVCVGGTVDICIPATTTCGTINCASLQITVPPGQGTATPQPNCAACGGGSCCIRYTAPAGATGNSVSFTYSVASGGTPGCVDTGTVTVNLCRVTPVADTATVCAGGTINIPVLANDTTNCGVLNCASLTITSGPSSGSATVVQNCSGGGTACPSTCIAYTAPANFSGTVTINYTIANNGTPACVGTGSVTINVCRVDAPDVTASVCVGSTVDICIPATTTCGTINCSSLSITVPPGQGSATVQPNCSNCGTGQCCIRYTAPAGATGNSVSFTYSVSNNGTPVCSDTGVVTVNLCRVTPVADAATVCAGSTINIPVLANDSTNCGALNCSTLAISVPPGQGSASVVQNCSGGGTACPSTCIAYTAPAGFSGTVTLSYTIANNQSPACVGTGTVTITVCQTNAPDVTASVCAGGTVDICIPATTTCGSVSCSTLLITAPPSLGTASPQANCANCGTGQCCIRFTAPANAPAGPVSFTYSVSSGGTPGCVDTGVVTVNICKVDAQDDRNLRVCAGGTIDIPVLANDTTSCNTLNCSSLVITSPPAQGTATVAQNCTGGGGACPTSCVRYTAPANFSGTVSFTYSVGNSGSPACTDTATVTIQVCQVNAPDLSKLSVCLGQSIDICIPATTNCGVINCASLTVVNAPSVGTATPQSNCSNCPAGSCCIRYTAPATTSASSVSFTYSVANRGNGFPVCSDTGTITINLCRVDAADDVASVCAGGQVNIPVLANDTTNCGALNCSSITILSQPSQGSVSVVSNCTGGGSSCPSTCIRYTAPANPTVTSVTFTYSVSNNQSPACSDTATVTVNLCRIEAGDVSGLSVCLGGTLDVCVPVTLIGGSCGQVNCSSLTITSAPAAGTATAQTNCTNCAPGTCCIRYTAPASTGLSSVSFTYSVSNNTTPACTDTGTVTINLCRVTANPDTAVICQGQTAVINVLANDNTSGTGAGCGGIDCKSLAIVSQPPSAAGTAVVDAGCASGSDCSLCVIRFIPNPNFTGVASFSYRVSTLGTPSCTATTTVSVTVNGNPIANDDTFTILAGQLPPYPIDLLGNDSAGIGCTLLSPALNLTLGNDLVVAPQHGTVVFNPVTNLAEYTPGPSFTGADSFQYRLVNSCGCVDTAVVTIENTPPCPTVNRQECGSLLLFPEFDNRAGQRTLFTITNACCENLTGNTRIEIVYIDKTACLETNRTYTLTPCDTVTLLTSSSGLMGQQGYAYVFAKSATPNAANPNGVPIVFNRLIGQSVMLDGIATFEYAVNPVVFKAYGQEGAPNDDDNDGIRDLNGDPTAVNVTGMEYDPAPEQIVIPRFLAQDGFPSADVWSEVVLVALSGGAEFTTTLKVLGYNDNEQAYSSEYSFNCWDKVPLNALTGNFAQQSFLSVGGDPDEIVGWNTRDAGWLLLDGLVANSAQESIKDPAFYALLVERAYGEFAATLPYELCLQPNGDLVPRSLFGDGPNPVGDDNQ
jgi:hypothetical protein